MAVGRLVSAALLQGVSTPHSHRGPLDSVRRVRRPARHQSVHGGSVTAAHPASTGSAPSDHHRPAWAGLVGQARPGTAPTLTAGSATCVTSPTSPRRHKDSTGPESPLNKTSQSPYTAPPSTAPPSDINAQQGTITKLPPPVHGHLSSPTPGFSAVRGERDSRPCTSCRPRMAVPGAGRALCELDGTRTGGRQTSGGSVDTARCAGRAA